MTRDKTLSIFSVILLSFAYFRIFLHWDFDDGMIVYRVVRNIIEGYGWRYNSDELVNASTSVLNTSIISLTAYFIGDIPLSAHIWGFFWILLSGILCFLILDEKGRVLALFSALVGVYLLSYNYTWGLETNLFIALALWFVWAEIHEKNSWPILGLILLARPDGILLVGLKTAHSFLKTRKIPFLGLFTLFAMVLPWAIYSLQHFGQLFPNTFEKKIWQGRSGYWGNGYIYLKAFAKHLFESPPRALTYLVGFFGFVDCLKARSPLLFIGFFCIVQQIAYIFMNVPGYHWYFGFADFAAWLFASYAISSRIGGGIRSVPLLNFGSAALAIIYAFYRITYFTPITDPRNEAYKKVIDNIEQSVTTEGPVATLEVGTIGYHTKRKIIDLVGLTSSNHEYITGSKIDSLFESAPEIILLHSPPWHFERAVASDFRLGAMYGPPKVIPDPLFPMQYSVLQRKGISVEDAKRYIRTTYPSLSKIPKEIEVNESTSTSALCIVDQVNGTLLTMKNLDMSPTLLHIVGWAVDSKEGTTPEVFVVLSRADGTKWWHEARRTERQDVADHLKDARYIKSGFELSTSLLEMEPGSYSLDVYLRIDQHFDSCRLGLNLTINPL